MFEVNYNITQFEDNVSYHVRYNNNIIYSRTHNLGQLGFFLLIQNYLLTCQYFNKDLWK